MSSPFNRTQLSGDERLILRVSFMLMGLASAGGACALLACVRGLASGKGAAGTDVAAYFSALSNLAVSNLLMGLQAVLDGAWWLLPLSDVSGRGWMTAVCMLRDVTETFATVAMLCWSCVLSRELLAAIGTPDHRRGMRKVPYGVMCWGLAVLVTLPLPFVSRIEVLNASSHDCRDHPMTPLAYLSFNIFLVVVEALLITVCSAIYCRVFRRVRQLLRSIDIASGAGARRENLLPPDDASQADATTFLEDDGSGVLPSGDDERASTSTATICVEERVVARGRLVRLLTRLALYPLWAVLSVLLSMLVRLVQCPWQFIVAAIVVQPSNGLVDAILFAATNRHARCCGKRQDL